MNQISGKCKRQSRKRAKFYHASGKLKDTLSFDKNIQPEKRYQIKDEVSFSTLDIPTYYGSNETKKLSAISEN